MENNTQQSSKKKIVKSWGVPVIAGFIFIVFQIFATVNFGDPTHPISPETFLYDIAFFIGSSWIGIAGTIMLIVGITRKNKGAAFNADTPIEQDEPTGATKAASEHEC